jgi:hypothetical protein
MIPRFKGASFRLPSVADPHCRPPVADGAVYWGTGYRTFAPVTTPGNSLFAFTPNGG